MMQQTIRKSVSFHGIGVHSGQPMTCTLFPAPVHHGIVFKRSDVAPQNALIPALWDHVVNTTFCTTLGNEAGVVVKTVEHLMAALFALEIDNVLIEITGPEMPILDGSSLPFYTEIKKAGIKQQEAPRQVIRVLKPIKVQHKDTWALLEPADEFSVTYSLKMRNTGVLQTFSSDHMAEDFQNELAPARTFGFIEDAEKLHQAGFALGASLDNTVVFDGEHIMNESGLRFEDECARHKALDAVGDLALAGYPLQGRFTGYGSGHTLNNILLQTLFRDKSAWILSTDAPSSHMNVRYRKGMGPGLDARAAS